MIRRSVDYRQDLTNHIRLCKFLVGDTPNDHTIRLLRPQFEYIFQASIDMLKPFPGGGLGGTRRGGADVNIKHSGRDDASRYDERPIGG